MSKNELNSVTFRWEAFSSPVGITVHERGALTIQVHSSAHLDELMAFFHEVYSVLVTTRNVYGFRNDNDE